jgi:hypothetical protein
MVYRDFAEEKDIDKYFDDKGIRDTVERINYLYEVMGVKAAFDSEVPPSPGDAEYEEFVEDEYYDMKQMFIMGDWRFMTPDNLVEHLR